jgi:hypothetical protein
VSGSKVRAGRATTPNSLIVNLVRPSEVGADLTFVLLERREEEVRVERGGGKGEHGEEETGTRTSPARGDEKLAESPWGRKRREGRTNQAV